MLEELARLGVQKAALKKHRFLHPTASSSVTSSSKGGKGKPRGKRSPGKSAVGKSPLKLRDERKNTPKSPFMSAKRRAEVKKQNAAAAAAAGDKENKTKVCCCFTCACPRCLVICVDLV